LRWPTLCTGEIEVVAFDRAEANPRREEHMGGKLGLPEILIILAVALLVFGPSKLADLGKGLGEGIKNFKSAVKDGEEGSEKKS
jgi:sec-independent protein translocase protein TatA